MALDEQPELAGVARREPRGRLFLLSFGVHPERRICTRSEPGFQARSLAMASPHAPARSEPGFDRKERLFAEPDLGDQEGAPLLLLDMMGVRSGPEACLLNMRHSLRDWVSLLTLVVVWGTAFSFIYLAVQSIPPLSVAAGRIVSAAAVLYLAVRAAGLRLPPPGRIWLHFLLLGIVGNVLPFYLISWGQERVASGVAGILMAMNPLVTLLLAHFFVHGESLSRNRVSGFLLGFAGVAVLMGPGALLGIGGEGSDVVRQGAVLGGSLCYAPARDEPAGCSGGRTSRCERRGRARGSDPGGAAGARTFGAGACGACLARARPDGGRHRSLLPGGGVSGSHLPVAGELPGAGSGGRDGCGPVRGTTGVDRARGIDAHPCGHRSEPVGSGESGGCGDRPRRCYVLTPWRESL